MRGGLVGLVGVALILGAGAASASGSPSMGNAGSAAGAAGLQPMASSSSGPNYEISWAYLDFEREYDWRLEKTGQVDDVTLGQGSATANLDYTVSAIPDGYSDVNRLIRVRGEFQNNLIPKTIYPKARATVGGEVIECTTKIIGDRGSFVGANRGRQLRADCPIPSHNNSDEISVTAWVDWRRIGMPDGTSRDSASDDIEDNMKGERYKSVEVVDNKTEPGQEHSLGTAQWNDAGDPVNFNYSVKRSGLSTGDCKEIGNEASIPELDKTVSHQMQVCPQDDLIIDKTIDSTFDRTYHWDLSKSGRVDELLLSEDAAVATLGYEVTAIPDEMTEHDAVVRGKITVRNPNAQGEVEPEFTSVVKDDTGKQETCDVTPTGSDPSIEAGQTKVFDYQCDLGEGSFNEPMNHLTVTWEGEDRSEGETEITSLVDLRLDGEIDKFAQIYDDKTVNGDLHYIGTADWHDGETTFEYSITSEEIERGECTEFTNNAWIDSTNDHASSTVEVCPDVGLVIDKDISATFDRIYDWDLAKTGDVDAVRGDGDSASATFGYTVTATPDGYRDVNPQVSGQIEVTNPNTDGDPIPATVTDVLGSEVEEVTCEVTHEGTPAVDVPVAPEQTVVFDYTCDIGDSIPEGVTNKATVTSGEGERVSTIADSEFKLGEELHRTATVMDDKTVSGAEHELGVAEWNDDAEATVFDYTLTQTQLPVGECIEFTNNAWIDGVDAKDSATVEVCPKEGRLAPPSTEEPGVTGEPGPEGSDSGNPNPFDPSDSTDQRGDHPTGPGGADLRDSTPLDAGDSPEEGSTLPAMGAPVGFAALTAVALALIGTTCLLVTCRRQV